jgi:hypothetical protein
MANELIDSSQFIFYASSNGNINIQVIVQDESVWATQNMIAEIFDVTKSTISEHISNIIKDGELTKEATVRKFRTVQNEGGREVSRELEYYNLDMILSVGYRVNSAQATQFRKWANSVLREYLIKGFALDDDRLKQGSKLFGKDYFDDLIERIREIRASERLFYKKITDIYADCSVDYDPNAEITHEFYATVQNKLHFAIHGHTAAELIYERADANKPYMGLTSYKNEKKGGKVLQSDTLVAKNYLNEKEISELNRIVNMYLDYAENQAKRQILMKMTNWIEKLDAFLQFNEYDILKNAGKVSKKVADELAKAEYEKFRVIQDKEFVSDFDKTVEEIKSTGKIPKKLRK